MEQIVKSLDNKSNEIITKLVNGNLSTIKEIFLELFDIMCQISDISDVIHIKYEYIDICVYVYEQISNIIRLEIPFNNKIITIGSLLIDINDKHYHKVDNIICPYHMESLQ